jgi:hypothetical protein
MIQLIYQSNFLEWDGYRFEILECKIDGDLNVDVHLVNDSGNDFWVLFLANETTINGILHTSSEMIVDTLTS